jgi:hypothetical protein
MIGTASSIRSKRTLSSAFHAVAGFIQKANKKIRSQQQQQKEQKQLEQQQWSAETWLDEIRVSSDSSISTLDLLCPYYNKMTYRQQLASTRENWWTSSPPISSY